MSIEEQFNIFIGNLNLTDAQRVDAQVKYSNVVNCLSHYFFSRNSNSHDQYIFGSYKTKTNIRPLDNGSDVDVLFKIDKDTYEKYEDNPSGLLQEIRKALKEKYTTTEEIHAWGKVVLVKFSDGHHNVETLPAYENDEGSFIIPNTEKGGSWEYFDPHEQVNSFSDSNKKTDGLTRTLSMMIKNWVRNTSSLTYKSYQVVNDVISFLGDIYPNGKGGDGYNEIVQAFFKYEKSRISTSDDRYSHFKTAENRATKAVLYEKDGKHIEASDEWRKIFDSSMFPRAEKNEERELDVNQFSTAAKPWSL